MDQKRGIERMKKVSRLLAGIGIALAFATCASADISWTFKNVNFYLGSWSSTGTVYTEVASLTGSFSTNDAVTTVTNFSNLAITAVGGNSDFAFKIAGMVDDYLPGTIGIYSAGWSSYIDLNLTSPLKSGGGPYSFSAGYDCPGCAVLLLNTDPGVGAGRVAEEAFVIATPEPGFYAVFAIGLAGLGVAVRRKRAITRA